jgi:hypothetical protein
LSSGTLCSSATCAACDLRPATIISRSASLKVSPAISSALAIAAAVISVPACTRAQSSPGRSDEPSPTEAK